MKLLHTSDLHLGASLMGVSLLEEQAFMVGELIRIAQEQQVEAVLICGDVFDRSVSSAQAIALYDRLVTALCAQCPVLVLAGNHDGAERLSVCGELLQKSGLHVAGRLKLPLAPVRLGETDAYLLPWFNLDEARAQLGVPLEDYDAAMRAVLESVRPERPSVLLAHCFVRGGTLSESDRAAAVGGASAVAAGCFEKFSYAALGHLHRRQRIGHAWYAGTPMKYSFAEAGQTKSVNLVDTRDWSVQHIPVGQLREVRVLTGTLEELRACAQTPCGDYLKIQLTDCYAGLAVHEEFCGYFPNLLAMTGVQPQGGAQERMSAEQLHEFSPAEILREFLLEYTGEEPNDCQIAWFEQALAAADREAAQ